MRGSCPVCSSMSLTPQQMEAVRLLAMGQSYRQIEETVGIPKSTLSSWVNSKQEFKEAIAEARKLLWVGHQAVVDSYREALVSATKAAPRCVDLLLEIAESQDTRTSDKIKALEIILSKPRELMHIVNQGETFPEVGLAEAQSRAEEEQRLKRKLVSAGWIEVGEGVWTNPKDGNNWSYSITEAYKKVVEVN